MRSWPLFELSLFLSYLFISQVLGIQAAYIAIFMILTVLLTFVKGQLRELLPSSIFTILCSQTAYHILKVDAMLFYPFQLRNCCTNV
jgi:hypothetical protein